MESKKTHWKKVFNSDYLGSADLDDGRDLVAVIKSVQVQEVKGSDGKKQNCNVATFTEAKIKPMILNVTNCKVVKKFAKSPYINDWNNIPIQIYIKDDIKAFGEITEGLRIRPTQPVMTKSELTPEHAAWTGAIAYLKKEGATIAKIKEKYNLSPENEEKLKEASML